VGCSLDAGYRAARREEIAGLFRIGKLMRINWQAFVDATYAVGANGPVRAPESNPTALRTTAEQDAQVRWQR
jgi:hypothetical protein